MDTSTGRCRPAVEGGLRVLVASSLLLPSLGCGSDVRDEAPGSGRLVVAADEVHVVGTSDALSVVLDLEVLPDGRLWLLNSDPPLFVGFEPNGDLIATHGDIGGGPEEFQRPAGFVVGAPGGEAWVFDTGRHGLVRVSTPDEPWTDLRIPRTDLPPGTVQGGLDLLTPLVRTARLGDEVVLPHSTGTLESGVWSLVQAILRADLMAFDPRSGGIERVVSIDESIDDPFPGFNATEGGFPLWRRLWAVCAEDLRVYDRVRNQLRGFDRDGVEVQPVQLPPTGLAEIAPEDFARVIFPIRQAEVTGGNRLTSDDSLRLVRQMAGEVRGSGAELAAYLPPFVDFRCSGSGVMWLRPLDVGGGGLAGGRDWLRVGLDGDARVVTLPPRFDAFRFTEDRVFGVLRDDLDVPSVAWAQLPAG